MPEFPKFVALLVDDESSIRRLVSTVLEGAGFLTLSASNGTEALALCRDQGQRIHVLVTDVDLGDGDGIEFAQLIRRERPGNQYW